MQISNKCMQDFIYMRYADVLLMHSEITKLQQDWQLYDQELDYLLLDIH
jgi:hypothetical protein